MQSFVAEALAKNDELVPNAKIVVVGVGGAGNNSVTRLMDLGIEGAMTVAVNTDAQHLEVSRAHKKLLIGYNLTRGLGAGGYPEVGREAAEESRREIKEVLEDVNLVFITCGLGGGTGTGATPVIAEIAKGLEAIVVAVVTWPFELEKARMEKAECGLVELRKVADTVIVIDNNKLVQYYPDLPLNKAFLTIDTLIATMIKGITETITRPSLVNLDFADVKAIMKEGEVAVICTGEASTQNRAEEAVYNALSHPLLNVDYKGAKGALVHVVGGPDLTLREVITIGELVSSELDPKANVIWGARIDEKLNKTIRVMLILTGVKSQQILGPLPRDSKMRKHSYALPKRKPGILKDLDIDYVL